jgi:hypothetical protein
VSGGFAIETILELAVAPEAAFEFLADTAGFRAVDPALIELEPQGPLVEGLTGSFVHRRGGMRARTTWRVGRVEAPRRLTVEIRGMGYGMTEDVELEAVPGGTRARFVERVWPTSLPGRILVALSGGIMRRDLRARSRRLQQLLEAAG